MTGGSGERASARPLPRGEVAKLGPQSAEPGGEADKGALKDQLRPHGCRLLLIPTRLTDVTHRVTGNGLHWAHC